MRIFSEIVKIVAGVIIGAALVAFFGTSIHLSKDAAVVRATELTYADLAAINLTVATVVLGGVALSRPGEARQHRNCCRR